MLSKKLKKAFERECYYLEYYDLHGHFPFEKKKVTITLSIENIAKLQNLENRSKTVDDLLSKNL